MASFCTKTFIKHDDYMTPKHAWEDIEKYIPKDKVIWEAFYGDGESGKYLTEMGFNTIHEQIDFFKHDKGELIVSNPPFSLVKEIMPRLKELDKPFILLMPCSKICTSYMRENFSDKNIQIIIPRKRIHFVKKENGKVPDGYKSSCNFDCFYYCYKIGLMQGITWLQ